ncbi:high mobility group family, partial [Genlisea aurea]
SPAPVAAHDDVVMDSALFINTLRDFHSSMGGSSKIPVIGGKELNLHLLYVEVTKRGGYDKVVSEKKWREISSVFDFSPTTTSASYALRKHYFSILYRYELLYFLKSSPMPHQISGTIDGKFDCGYLVSVRMGDETLKGVLYHCPDGHRSSPTSGDRPIFFSPASCCNNNNKNNNAIVPYETTTTTKLQKSGGGRRARKRRASDPGRPKPNRSGYNFFFSEKHSTLKSLYPNREREFTKMIGESWNSLSPEERVVYQNYGLKDKERYQKEMKEYREKLM